jgi:hypothetical protein
MQTSGSSAAAAVIKDRTTVTSKTINQASFILLLAQTTMVQADQAPNGRIVGSWHGSQIVMTRPGTTPESSILASHNSSILASHNRF